MPTIHLDLKVGLSVEKTRTLLGEYSRGCSCEQTTYMPKTEFMPNEEKYFDTSTSDIFIFLCDFFGDVNPFTVTLINEDDSIQQLLECNVLVIECKSVKAIKITNTTENTYRAHIVK